MASELERLCACIEGNRQGMVTLQKLLTASKALDPENGGEGESEKAAILIKWLKQNGFTDSIDIKRIDAPDSRVKSGVRPNVIVTLPGRDDNFTIWIMAHLDVVPAGEESLWDSDPWSVIEKDGKLYGRGVEDNQQGLVSSVFCANAFIKEGIKPAHTVKLLFIADEEVGSKYGIRYLLETQNLFRKNDIIVIPDSGDKKGETIEIAEKSILWLRLHTKGKQAHGSRPDLAQNACLAASECAVRLHELEEVFNKKDSLFEPEYSTFTPTMRSANVSGINIIPGDDVFCMDCRILPCYNLKDVIKAVENVCLKIEKKYSVHIDIERAQEEESPATPIDAPVVKMLSRAIKRTRNIDAFTIGIGGGTVGAYLRRAGYNAACYSTIEDICHQPNEYCIIDNMVLDAKTFAALMLE